MCVALAAGMEGLQGEELHEAMEAADVAQQAWQESRWGRRGSSKSCLNPYHAPALVDMAPKKYKRPCYQVSCKSGLKETGEARGGRGG